MFVYKLDSHFQKIRLKIPAAIVLKIKRMGNILKYPDNVTEKCLQILTEMWKLKTVTWSRQTKKDPNTYFLSAYKSVLKWDLWDRHWYWYSSLPCTLYNQLSQLLLGTFRDLGALTKWEYYRILLSISFIMLGNPCKVFFKSIRLKIFCTFEIQYIKSMEWIRIRHQRNNKSSADCKIFSALKFSPFYHKILSIVVVAGAGSGLESALAQNKFHWIFFEKYFLKF